MPSRVSKRRARISASRGPISFRKSDAGGAVEFTACRGMGKLPLPGTRSCRAQNRNFGGRRSLNLLSFEVDIWGRLRRATEAARANLLSAEENRKAVITTLVSEVATDYFSLRELDYELEISQRTLDTRRESLRLFRNAQSGGVATLLDLRQAEQLVSTAAETIPDAAAADRTDREPDQSAAREESGRCARADASSSNRRCRRKCPRACLRLCSSAGPIFARRSRT